MCLNEVGEANHLAGEPHEARMQGEMFAFTLLTMALSWARDIASESPLVRAPLSDGVPGDVQRFQQRRSH